MSNGYYGPPPQQGNPQQGSYPQGYPQGTGNNPIIARVVQPPSTPNQGNNYNGQGTSWGGAQAGATGATVNVPEVNPNAYNYGGSPGGAQAFNSQVQGLAAAQAQQQGAQIQNQYDPRDQSQVQGTLGALSSYYQGQLNGTGPSLAAQQAKASMDQSVAAQMAAANSARGGLAGAAAQMAAAQQGAAAQQNAAQQSVQGRIAEEQAAAQGMQGVGQLGEGEQQINANTAYQQAALQQQQQDINAKMGLGYAGLENQVNTEQLNAQMQQQAQMSGNYLGASGMGMQQSQFNTTNNENLAMGGLSALGGLALAFADADLQEPGGPAHWTLREEPSFILAKNQRTGELRKLLTAPLSDREFNQAMARHGAGPLGADDPRRQRTTFHDMPMGGVARMPAPVPSMGGGMPMRPVAGPGGGVPARPVALPQQPMVPARATLGPRGLAAAPAPVGPVVAGIGRKGGQALAPPMPGAPLRAADMDLARTKQTRYADADMGSSLGDPSIQSGLGNLDWGASNAGGAGGGGTLMDQLRAQEAGRIAAAQPLGGYTTAQQQFYGPGASGLAGAQQGMTSDQAAAQFGGNGPSAGSIAGRAVATGGYGQGWDNVAMQVQTPAAQQGATKIQQAGADLAKQGLARMAGTQIASPVAPQADAGFTPMAVPGLSPMVTADMDLGSGLRRHISHLQAADADMKSRAKLGSGKRFSHLEHSLAHRPGVHDPGALAAYIGRERYGSKKMAGLAAAHRGK